MMSSDLQVTTAHVRELAAKQGQAAAEIRSATEVTAGVDTAVRFSHGVIAWSTAGAVEAAQHARVAAGTAMGQASEELRDDLQTAASRYDATDQDTGALLDAQMAPR